MEKKALKKVLEKYMQLDETSQALINSQVSVLLARQEMEKGVSDNVAQGNSDVRER